MSLDTLVYMKSENLSIPRKICGQIKVDKNFLGCEKKINWKIGSHTLMGLSFAKNSPFRIFVRFVKTSLCKQFENNSRKLIILR